MKKTYAFLLIFVTFSCVAFSQKVDSIRTELSGDFIKIRYKILDSKPGEIYSVKVLCSINGGLNTELRSISGDVGDHVQGGLPEYWVVWDVLKDVDQIESAEFIVRAELKNVPAAPLSKKVNTSGWDKKGVNMMFESMLPGPKLGIRAGYMGNFGFLIMVAGGQNLTRPLDYQTIENFDPPKNAAIGIALTKRVINKNGFQMHVTGGIVNTHTAYYNTKAPDHPWSMQDVKGVELGLAFGIKRLALSLAAVNFDPRQNERGTDLAVASPRSYFSGCIGVRF